LKNCLFFGLGWAEGETALPARVAVRFGTRSSRESVALPARRARARRALPWPSADLRYIERDGVEKDGSKGVAYAAGGPARVESFEQPRSGERHQFRLIISPEDAGELDLTDYLRRVMARVERDLDRKLEWLAVNHFDTEHPHAHVVIRGVDRRGRDRGYIANGLRWSAQEIATQELGPRHDLDVQRACVREITQKRFTALDRELERRMVEGRVEVRWRGRPGRIDESTLVARLAHLEGMRLAERGAASSWSLAQGWQGRLRDLGSRGDILKQIHAAVRHGLYFDLRDRRPGRDSRRYLFPTPAFVGGSFHRACGARGGREAVPARAHDNPRGDARSDAGGPFERHWRTDAEAAGDRRDRRLAYPRCPHANSSTAPARVGASVDGEATPAIAE